MAERRMFAKTIVLSDAFLDMPLGARCLYMTLGMVADDDGFVNNPRSIMRQAGATDDDMKILLAKKFVLLFDDGVIVIKHWRINNYLQRDRYKATVYKEDFDKLTIDEKNIYHMAEEPCIQDMCIHRSGQVSIGQDSIGQVSQGQVSQEETADVPDTEVPYEVPTIDMIRAYCQKIGTKVDPERFFSYYSDRGGWQGIRSWRALLRSWAKGDDKRPAPSSSPQPQRKGSYFVPTAPNKWQEAYDAGKIVGEDDGLTDEELEEFNQMLRGGSK